jgi:hypothetical protein
MTQSLSAVAQDLLRAEVLHRPLDLASQPTIAPAQGGIYAWWFDGCLPQVSRDGCLVRDERALLYVGICPSGAAGTSGRRTLRDRMKNHCRGPIANSTLRRTLVALVGFDLSLKPVRVGRKLLMAKDEERALTQWMDEHARVGWIVWPAPWEVEAELLAVGPTLPLNVAGSRSAFRDELQRRRRLLASGG